MPEISSVPSGDLLTFRDCAEILQSGVTDNGVYVIRLPNSTQTVKVVAALERFLTFSRKCHLTNCDTKYNFLLESFHYFTQPPRCHANPHKHLTLTFVIYLFF